MTEREKEFLDWLADQEEYWIPVERIEREWPDAEFDLLGVTSGWDDQERVVTPRRDWRRGFRGFK